MDKLSVELIMSKITYPENKIFTDGYINKDLIHVGIECDCCWSILIPTMIEYDYIEWLNSKNIIIEKRDYIVNQHRKDANIIYFLNKIQKCIDINFSDIPIIQFDNKYEYQIEFIKNDLINNIYTTSYYSFYNNIDLYKKIIQLYCDIIKSHIYNFSNYSISDNYMKNFNKYKLNLKEQEAFYIEIVNNIKYQCNIIKNKDVNIKKIQTSIV